MQGNLPHMKLTTRKEARHTYTCTSTIHIALFDNTTQADCSQHVYLVSLSCRLACMNISAFVLISSCLFWIAHIVTPYTLLLLIHAQELTNMARADYVSAIDHEVVGVII